VVRFIRSERFFLLTLLVWLITGILFAPSSWIVIPVFLMLLRRKKMYLEMLMGFFVILVLSDSRQYSLHFAGDIKDIYLVILAFFIATDRPSFSPGERLVYKYLPFIFIAICFIAMSDVVLTTLQKTISYVLLFIVVPNYVGYGWRTQAHESIRRFIWTGILILLAGFILRFISPNLVTLAGRYCGVLGNPNGLGLFCLLLLILTTVITDLIPGMFTRREHYLIWGVILASLILCGSRSAVFTVLLFFMMRYFYKISPFLGVFAFLVLILIYQLILSNIEGIIIALNLQEYFRLATFQNASGRLIAWQFGWDKISENPILGHGIGYTEYYYRKNYDFLAALGHQGNAHNSYITFWIDTGLFGLLAYLGATFSVFVKGLNRSSVAIPAMLAIVFSAFFESWLTASLNPFTIQFVLILTLFASPLFTAEAIEERVLIDVENSERNDDAEHEDGKLTAE
jgi:O-antigen ligase